MPIKTPGQRFNDEPNRSPDIFQGIIHTLGVDTLLSIIKTTKADIRAGRTNIADVQADGVILSLSEAGILFGHDGQTGHLDHEDVRHALVQHVETEIA